MPKKNRGNRPMPPAASTPVTHTVAPAPPPPEANEPTLEQGVTEPFIDPAPVNAGAAAQDSLAREMAQMMSAEVMSADGEADPLNTEPRHVAPSAIAPPAPSATKALGVAEHGPALTGESLRALLKPVEHGAVTLPDGSMRVGITISEDMVLVLREWALGAEEDFVTYVQRQAEIGLNAIVLGTAAG